MTRPEEAKSVVPPEAPRDDRTSNDSPHRESSEKLRGYTAMLGIFGGGLLVSRIIAARTKRALPLEVPPLDLVTIGIATHRLSMTLSQDRITKPIRAPFTHDVPVAAGKTQEKARGQGLRETIGELATCKFCLTPWIAAGLFNGLVFAPRSTRILAGIFTTSALADFLHLGYSAARKAAL